LTWTSSQSRRSDRIVWNACGNGARISRSGGMEGRPSGAQAASNAPDMPARTSSEIRRITREGVARRDPALRIDIRKQAA